MVCLETLTWAVHRVLIPCQLDYSSAVEVYTSWVLYSVKSMILALASVSCAIARSLKEGGNFTDSKSFIMALHSRRPDDLGTGLVDLLLADCVCQAELFARPRHLYSHQDGTFPDAVLDAVDSTAKIQALQQPYPMPVGYIEGLQPSQTSFSNDGVQWHDASTVQDRLLRRLYEVQQEVKYAPEVASYAFYTSCVASSSLSWGKHLRMVPFHHGLDTSNPVMCAFYDSRITAAHFQEGCQYSDLWANVLYTQLASDLRRIVPEWGLSLPTLGGVLLQWGGAYLGLTVGAISTCPVREVTWVTSSLSGRTLPALEKALVGHGATPKQVRTVLVTLWKTILRMSRTAHPP